MIHDAAVEVTCDVEHCNNCTSIQLDWNYRNMSSSSGFYDASDEAVEKKLVREGWAVRDGKHYCDMHNEEKP